MAGLMMQNTEKEQGMAAPEGMPGQETPQDSGEEQANVSPEEQEAYDTFMANYMRLAYSKEVGPKILDMLKGAGEPKEGLAQAAAFVVKHLADDARQNGVEISPDIMMSGGLEIVEDLAEMQADAGFADLSEDEIEGAFYRALDIYREAATADGTLNTEALQQDFAGIVEADKAGQLDQVVPGATEAAQRMQAQSAPMEDDETQAPPVSSSGRGLMSGGM